MRTLALLLLIPACTRAQLKLTPQDESEIRAAINEQAKKDNQRPSSEIWSERGPIVYRVRRIRALAPNVADADAEGVNTGAFPSGPRPFVFILTRSEGRWTVARRIEVCTGVKIQPVSEWPQYAGHGSSDHPN